MKIAIHHRPGSFSDRWIAYCERENIPYKIVDALQSDIIDQMKDCDALMWHHHHGHFKDVLAARKILFALEHAGVKVFPDFRTGWHFDDKVAQKYLLEAIGAPLVPSYVFYDKEEALTWAKNTDYPKVFKLKGGAGSANVKLVRNRGQAKKLIRKAFGRGFPQFDRWGNLRERIRRYRDGQDSLMGVAKGLGRIVIPTQYSKLQNREKGYVYFQDFIPKNDYDIRIIIIGDRAFGVKRMVRKNDFRASGSDIKKFEKEEIDIKYVKLAFDLNKKLKSQSIALDFILKENNPVLVEISYGFSVEFYDPCPGYWDHDLQWHEGKFTPQEWMVEDLIELLQNNSL